MALNNVTIAGRMVTAPVLGKTANKGVSVVNFRLMHNDRKLRNPVYVDVEVWGKEAEACAQFGQKGAYVIVHAELRRDVWSAEDGSPRSKLKLTASKVLIDQSVPLKTSFDGENSDSPEVF